MDPRDVSIVFGATAAKTRCCQRDSSLPLTPFVGYSSVRPSESPSIEIAIKSPIPPSFPLSLSPLFCRVSNDSVTLPLPLFLRDVLKYPCTVQYKVKVNFREKFQFHMNGDIERINLRYILQNFQGPILKYLYYMFLGGFPGTK